MAQEINELVARVFAIRNAAHLAHWNTPSFATHMALGDFYDGVIDKIDTIVEAYQGWFDLIGDVPSKTVAYKDIVDQIGEDAMWISTNRAKISRDVPMLQNLLDDLTDLYSTTHYKLVHLS